MIAAQGLADTYLCQSRTEPTRVYLIAHFREGVLANMWICNCPAVGNCWHIIQAKELEGERRLKVVK